MAEASDPDLPWTARAGGVTLAVRLTPKSARDDLGGCERRDDGRVVLRARVRAVPEDGKANAALMKMLAGRLGLPASALTVASGATSRTKILTIAGDPEALSARLAALAEV